MSWTSSLTTRYFLLHPYAPTTQEPYEQESPKPGDKLSLHDAKLGPLLELSSRCTPRQGWTCWLTGGCLQVSQIKEKVEEKEGIPPVQQRLIYGGKQMYVLTIIPGAGSCPRPFQGWGERRREKQARLLTLLLLNNRVDDKTATDYQLEGGATLHLVLALRGGRQ